MTLLEEIEKWIHSEGYGEVMKSKLAMLTQIALRHDPVRCKDCANARPSPVSGRVICATLGIGLGDEFSCIDGHRKEVAQ